MRMVKEEEHHHHGMRIHNGKVWDAVRGRWLVLTPEEWVRQHTIAMLTDTLSVEPHRIGREVALPDGRRADLVVFDRAGSVRLIVECKAQSVAITREVFEQIAQYNMALGGGVPYLAVTNGVQLYCCQYDELTQSYKFIENLPQL